jgi:predicted dehydrogenase
VLPGVTSFLALFAPALFRLLGSVAYPHCGRWVIGRSIKLNVAAIGCGGQGGVILNDAARTENIVALCDVDEARGGPNLSRYNKAAKYEDFRVMLDKEGKNIDACTIGIPDFMHATVALACMQRGKHVYVEKPLTRTPWEARLLQDAAVKYKVATQMGNLGFSHESHRVAAEIVWSGEVGDVTEVHITTTPGTHPTGLQQFPPEESAPANLDWNLWLGSAPMRPYSSYYVPYNWRGFYDFGTGQIGNWATHAAGPAHVALQLGAPTSVERVAVVNDSKITFPDRAVIRLDFPARGEMPPVKVFYHDSSRAGTPEAYVVPGMEKETILPPPNNLVDKGRPGVGRPRTAGGPAPATAPPKRDPNAAPVAPGFGSSAIVTAAGRLQAFSPGMALYSWEPKASWRHESVAKACGYFHRNGGRRTSFLRNCSRVRPVTCSIGFAPVKAATRPARISASPAPFAEWLALAAIAFRVPGRLDWDSKNLRFTNNVDANKYIRPVFRRGWELKL